MSFNKRVRRTAIIGTGVIGASWSAFYLARGFNVVATDPAPHAEEKLRRYVDSAWSDLSRLGLTANASPKNLEFTANMKQALTDADFVQDNGPERADFKVKLFADLDQASPVDSIIASSSSGPSRPTAIQVPSKWPGGEHLKLTVSSPLQVRDVPKVSARRAPDLGQHNEEVLKQLGFTGREIDDLRAGGAIPHAPQLEAAATAPRR